MSTAVICNLYGDGNLGGAAITAETVAFVHKLAGESGQITGLALQAEATQSSYPETGRLFDRILPHPFSGCRSGLAQATLTTVALIFGHTLGDAGLSSIKDADLVVSKGGNLFAERPDGRREWLRLYLSAAPILFARRVGTDSVLYSSSFGPSRTKHFRWVLKTILWCATVVLPRDPDSDAFVRHLSPQTATVPMFDCVAAGDFVPRIASDLGRESDRDRYAVAISLRERSIDGRRYSSQIAEWIVTHVPTSEKVALVGQSSGDIAAMVEIQGLLSGHVTVDAYPTPSIEDAVSIYAASEMALSSRLHGAIFAALAGTPCLLLEHDPRKSEPILRDLGLPIALLRPREGETLDNHGYPTRVAAEPERLVAARRRNLAALLETSRILGNTE